MKLFVGVDVSKSTLDVYINGQNTCVPNNDKGLKKLLSLLKKQERSNNEIGLVLCEATGGYEKKLTNFMLANKMPMHVAHANKIRLFAKARGLLAKTDKIDAYVIAEYGQIMQPKVTEVLRTEEEKLLAELVRRREQLVKDRSKEGVRLDKGLSKIAKKSIEKHIKWLDKEIEAIETEMCELQKNEALNKKIGLLKSIPSVGDVTARAVAAFLPEIGGVVEYKQITSLVGLAPFAKESGQYKGKRRIQGGRAIIRRSLYMAAISASAHYKEMREFYQRLRQKGKEFKVAIIAVARKLLGVIYSVMQRQTAWQEVAP